LVLVGGYEALDLALPSVHGRAILENEDEGVESLILHFNGEAHLPACARSDALDVSNIDATFETQHALVGLVARP
jgi:hypothetical protein